MAEASTSTPTLPIGGYTTHTLSPDELDTWNRQAETRRAAIRASAMRAIGRDPDGNPLPRADDAEERRLETADLRGARGTHLKEARGVLRQLEERAAAGERAAADQLVASFRGSETVDLGQGCTMSPPATSEIDTARLAVQRTEAAVERLAGEVETSHQELVQAQSQVGRHVLDVVKAELLAIAAQVEEHERAAGVLRANLSAAGYVTGSLQQRRVWQRIRIFTRRMLAALHHQPPERAPAPSVDGEGFIARLYDDPEAELTRGRG